MLLIHYCTSSPLKQVTDLHNSNLIQQQHQHQGGPPGTFPQQHPNYHRSVSEFPNRRSTAMGGNGWVFSSPPPSTANYPATSTFRPANTLWRDSELRRASATSLIIPSNGTTPLQQLYPNKRAERSSFVRRAAHNFRKGSLASQQQEGLDVIESVSSSSKGNSLTRSISLEVKTVSQHFYFRYFYSTFHINQFFFKIKNKLFFFQNNSYTVSTCIKSLFQEDEIHQHDIFDIL